MIENIQNLGAFGFSTWEKILSHMREYLKGSNEKKYVSSFWKNETLIKNLDRSYLALMSRKRKPATPTGTKKDFYLSWDAETVKLAREIQNDLSIPIIVIYAYFNAIYKLATAGKIPFQKYDPLKYAETEAAKKTLTTEKNIFDIVKKQATDAATATRKIIVPVAIIAATGTAVYFYNQIKLAKKLTR